MTRTPQRTSTILLATLLAVAAVLTGAGAALAQQPAPLPAPELIAQPADRAVELTWTEVTGAVRYQLWSWRNEETGWVQIGGDNLTGTSYTHSNLVAGITYHYQIRAIDADDQNGEWSERITATTPHALDPPALSAQPAAGAVELSWTEVDTAARYILWTWWNQETGWQQLGGDDLTATGFTHADLTVGTTYYYQIRAENAAGERATGRSRSLPPSLTRNRQLQRLPQRQRRPPMHCRRLRQPQPPIRCLPHTPTRPPIHCPPRHQRRPRIRCRRLRLRPQQLQRRHRQLTH